MKIFNQKPALIIENFGGLLFGIVMFVLMLFVQPIFQKWIDIIKEFPSIGMCTFGFLLTFLSIILQGNNETISWIKKQEVLFNRLKSYNKRIVFLSLFLSLFAYFLAFFDFDWFSESLDLSVLLVKHLKSFLLAFFIGLASWLIVDLFRFIKIFYLLIKK